MQGFIKFFHHLFNPHCEECAMEKEREREDKRESAVCKSCDTLRFQLELTQQQVKTLLDALTHKDEVVPQQVSAELQPIMPRHVPWRVKQQMLESESRQAAAILKKKLDELNPDKPRTMHVTAPASPSISTEELEKEMDLVEEERENDVRNTGQGS